MRSFWSDISRTDCIGYAFRLGRRINLTLNVDHSWQYYFGYDKGSDESWFTLVYLGFDWY